LRVEFPPGQDNSKTQPGFNINEARKLTWLPGFKAIFTMWEDPRPTLGTRPAKSRKFPVRARKAMPLPKPCKNLIVDHSEYLELLRSFGKYRK